MTPGSVAQCLLEAYREAAKSPDPSTQNGAVVVGPCGAILGRGHNRFARGIDPRPDRLADRAQKYARTVHAESSALWDAIRNGHAGLLPRATLYVCWYACDDCAKHILEAGVRRVVGHADHPGFADPHGKWGKLVEAGLDMLAEAGVARGRHAGPIAGAPPIRIDYKPWSPAGD